MRRILTLAVIALAANLALTAPAARGARSVCES